ncbi:MAG: DinB family protein [Variovorax sp.]
MELVHYFAGLARYHAWATHRLLDEHLAGLTDDEWYRDCGLFFRSIHRTVNHLLLTDDIWYSRLADKVSLPLALDTELHAGRADVATALKAAMPRWSQWLAGLDCTRLDGEVAYTRFNGEQIRIPFGPTLGHAFNHATHHRGQITAALTAMGRPGPELDWRHLIQQEAHRP